MAAYQAVETLKESGELAERVESNPTILGGKPVVKGTRIPIKLITELLSAGYDAERIIAAYPVLTEDDIKAAAQYALCSS